MITYTVIKPFTIMPTNILMDIGDTLDKYEESVLVKVGINSITSLTFYTWVGSNPSLSFLEYVSQSEDPSEPSITPIDTLSNYTTTDIVNKINEVIDAASTGYGVPGEDGATGPTGATGATGPTGPSGVIGDDGRDAGVLILPKTGFQGGLPDGGITSLVGYLVWLSYNSGTGQYTWIAQYGYGTGDEAQYVIIDEDATSLTVFPMGGNMATTAPHTIALPVTLPVSLVLSGTPAVGGYIGPVHDGIDTAYKFLGYSEFGNEFAGNGSAQMKIIALSEGLMTLIDGGGVPGGT